MSLDIKQKKINDVPVLELVGRAIDVDVEKFSKKLESLYKKGVPKIIVDLSRTNFVDSHCLGIIVYNNTLLQKEKREFVIMNANPDKGGYVHRLFELTNLDKVLRIVASQDEV
jgi:anti-anti-sigma factor